MRSGLLTELADVFVRAGCSQSPLLEEVLELLREGDRLRRREDRASPVPPSSRRAGEGPASGA